jgi:hypothetical protein
VDGASIQIVHYFDHGYLVISRRKNQWYIVSQLLSERNIWQAWATSVPPYETFSLIKNNILHQSKNCNCACNFLWRKRVLVEVKKVHDDTDKNENLIIVMLIILKAYMGIYGRVCRQTLWAKLIINNPRWHEQHIYETVRNYMHSCIS